MTREQILEIVEKYKLRIPPTVFYDLKADIVNFEEPTTKNDLEVDVPENNVGKIEPVIRDNGVKDKLEPTTKDDLGVDCIDRAQAQIEIEMNASRYTIAKERGGMGQVEWSDQLIKVSDAVDVIRHLPSVTPQESIKPVLEDIKNILYTEMNSLDALQEIQRIVESEDNK